MGTAAMPARSLSSCVRRCGLDAVTNSGATRAPVFTPFTVAGGRGPTCGSGMAWLGVFAWGRGRGAASPCSALPAHCGRIHEKKLDAVKALKVYIFR